MESIFQAQSVSDQALILVIYSSCASWSLEALPLPGELKSQHVEHVDRCQWCRRQLTVIQNQLKGKAKVDQAELANFSTLHRNILQQAGLIEATGA